MAGVAGCGGVLDEGAARVEGVCRREERGEEEENEKPEGGGVPHIAVYDRIYSLVFEAGGVDCQGLIVEDEKVVKSGDVAFGLRRRKDEG